MSEPLHAVIQAAAKCRLCEPLLPLGARPIFSAKPQATVLLLGHAPGSKVHASGVPWDDASGNTLREWMGLDRGWFYDNPLLAIVPTGLCYSGKGRSGDLPPRPECAPLWQPRFRAALPKLQLILAIGAHAQAYELGPSRKSSLSDTVAAWHEYQPGVFPLPHPSPRNRKWIRDRPWFERDVLPALRQSLAGLGL